MQSFRAAHLALAILVASASACARGPEAGPIEIRGVTLPSPDGRRVEVTGLSASELRALERAGLETGGWQPLLRVAVAGNETPVTGRYEVHDGRLQFVPLFPFDADRSYEVRFDPARLPTPRSHAPLTARLRFSAPAAAAAPASVTAVYPSGEVWPENMLRFYLHFSAPMSRTHGTKFIHLIDDRGEEVEDAILAAYSDLWNDEGTRLTVFFDPGRVKRGVGPNLELGRALIEDRRYTIAVDAEWPDANGQPLASPFRRDFTAGPPAYDGLSLMDWRITAPASGSTRPLAVTFPAPLDHALLGRAIGVRTADGRDVAGRHATGAHETVWTFTPAEPWRPGTYRLVVLTLLEDPAGNRVGQPFEILPDTPVAETRAEVATLAFTIE
jgi:hypothetical protein